MPWLRFFLSWIRFFLLWLRFFLPWLIIFYPDWGFSCPDWGFSTLTEVFLPWLRVFYPDWGFSYPDWGFSTLTEVFLPWLRFFRAFSSVVRQMPEYTSQRRGTVRTLPNYWIVFYVLSVSAVLFYVLFVSIVLFYVLFVPKWVLYYCHRVSIQLQLNIYHNTWPTWHERWILNTLLKAARFILNPVLQNS